MPLNDAHLGGFFLIIYSLPIFVQKDNMNNWDLIRLVNIILRKNINGSSFTMSDYETAINASSLRLFKRKLGLPEEYSKGQAVAQQGVGVSKEIDAELSVFFRKATKTAVSGTIDMTAENPAFISYMIPNPLTARGFDEVTAGELPDRLMNAITAPTLSDPIVVRGEPNKFDVYPSGILGATVGYLKFPTPAVVRWTRNETTLSPEYDAINSVELEWSDISKVDIAYMILRDAGMSIERRDIEQYANELVKTGK
jgi:hypothetical protein